MPVVIGAKPVPVHQADATLNQALPVSGTKYTILDTIANGRIITVGVSTAWTVQPTPLEVYVTIDGVSYTATLVNPVTATLYMLRVKADQTTETIELAVAPSPQYKAFLFEGRSIKVEAEITGGTVQSLRGKVVYALY